MSTLNRNQKVVETFDDFARAVEVVDFNVEDIVGQVTSLSKTFYWLNVESVWGQLGFTWDSLNADKLGYGHFNTTTIPFSIIPKLPDGERITRFSSTLNNMEATNIVIQRSNWENLTHLNNFSSNKSIVADFIGANITNVTSLFTGKNSTLYLKVDLTNAIGNMGGNGAGYYSDKGYTTPALITDDDNKYLNISEAYFKGVCLHYKGEDYFRLEYYFNEDYLKEDRVSTNNRISILSDNHKYYLTLNKCFLLGDNAGNGSCFNISDFRGKNSSYTDACEVILDCRYLTTNKKIVVIGQLLPTGWQNGELLYTRFWKPLKLIGDYDSIDVFNPFVLIDENYRWTDEGFNYDSNYGLKAASTFRFMPGSSIKVVEKCPYNITFNEDCKNIFIFNNSSVTTTIDIVNSNFNCLNYTFNGNVFKVFDWYPLINVRDMTKTITLTSIGKLYSGNTNYRTLFNQTIECAYFNLVSSLFFFDEDFNLTCYGTDNTAQTLGNSQTNVFYDVEHPHITIKFDEVHYNSLNFYADASIIFLLPSDPESTTINYIKFDTGTGDYIDRDVIRRSPLRQFYTIPSTTSTNLKIRHPVMLVGYGNSVDCTVDDLAIVDESCPFIFIKNRNISIVNNDTRYNLFINKIYPNLEVSTGKTTTFKTAYYNMLTEEMRTHIVLDLGMIIKEQ